MLKPCPLPFGTVCGCMELNCFKPKTKIKLQHRTTTYIYYSDVSLYWVAVRHSHSSHPLIHPDRGSSTSAASSLLCRISLPLKVRLRRRRIRGCGAGAVLARAPQPQRDGGAQQAGFWGILPEGRPWLPRPWERRKEDYLPPFREKIS